MSFIDRIAPVQPAEPSALDLADGVGTDLTPPRFTACINRPGYLPDADDVPEFESASDAWQYLLAEYRDAWSDVDTPYPDIWFQSGLDKFEAQRFDETGYLWTPTPGTDPDYPYDMGYNWSVSVAY